MKTTRAAMLLSLAVTSLAHAQSAGQWVVNAGWVHLAPQDSSQPLTVNALGQSAVVPGSGSTLANANTFALTTRYFVTDHVALETVFGIPPTLHLNGTGSLAAVGEMGTARAWSPAAQVQYHFGDPDARLRPYLGAGLAYVWYRDIELSRPLATGQVLASPATGSMLVGPTTASLSKSFAPLVNAGLTYNLDAHWSIGASVSYMWLSTKTTLTTQAPVGVVTTTTKVRINPLASFLSVGYRF